MKKIKTELTEEQIKAIKEMCVNRKTHINTVLTTQGLLTSEKEHLTKQNRFYESIIDSFK